MSESQSYPVGFGRAFAACLQNAHWGHDLMLEGRQVRHDTFRVYELHILPTVVEAWSKAPAAAQNAASILPAAIADDPDHHTKAADADTHGSASKSDSDSSIIHSPAKRMRLSCPDLPSRHTAPKEQGATYKASDFAPCIYIEEEPDDSGRLEGDWFSEARLASSRSSSSVPTAHQHQAAEVFEAST